MPKCGPNETLCQRLVARQSGLFGPLEEADVGLDRVLYSTSWEGTGNDLFGNFVVASGLWTPDRRCWSLGLKPQGCRGLWGWCLASTRDDKGKGERI